MSSPYDYVTYATALTAAAPTLDTDGIDMALAEGFQLTFSAESGQTLSLSSGSPRVLFWYRPIVLTRWVRAYDLDFDVNTSHAGARDVTFPQQITILGGGRLYAGVSGWTVSGGTTISTLIEVWRR